MSPLANSSTILFSCAWVWGRMKKNGRKNIIKRKRINERVFFMNAKIIKWVGKCLANGNGNQVLERNEIIRKLMSEIMKTLLSLHDFEQKAKMINRALIRKKLVQQLYAFNLRQGEAVVNVVKERESIPDVTKRLEESLEETYKLYHYLLRLVVDLTEYARRRLNAGMLKQLPTEEDLHPNMRFVENKFADAMRHNIALKLYLSDHEVKKGVEFSWLNLYPEVLKDIYTKLTESDLYKEYMSKETVTWEDDRELWRSVMRDFVLGNEELEAMMEDYSIFWTDDLEIVLSFVMKTIRRAQEEDGALITLMPKYKEEEDAEFAKDLLVKAIAEQEKARKLVANQTKNWDVDRLSLIDMTIMQLAITEFLDFPTIPYTVTLNEYIEIAKMYSTEQAPTFINGVLDAVYKKLDKEGEVMKVKILKKEE